MLALYVLFGISVTYIVLCTIIDQFEVSELYVDTLVICGVIGFGFGTVFGKGDNYVST